MKILAFIILGGCIGYTLGYVHRSSLTNQAEATATQLETDYAQCQRQETALKQRIVTADAQLSNCSRDRDSAQQASSSTTADDDASLPIAVASSLPSRESAPDVTTEQTDNEATVQELKAIQQVENRMGIAERLVEDKAFLKSVSLKNLSKLEVQLTPLRSLTTELKQNVGRFRGPLQFLKKERKRGRVILSIQEPVAKPFKPAVRVEVFDGVKDKTVYAGGPGQLKTLGGASAALFIESSDASYLQLYFVDEGRSWIGNYYEKDIKGRFVRAGTVKLVAETSHL